MLHEPAAQEEKDDAAPQKAKLGLILFLIYMLVYAGFVAIGLLSPELMGVKLILGQNVAIIYGFGLIILAVLMGFIYNRICSALEDKMNKKAGE
jgi:uncharacterized membrane protein (DUF485 family)